MSLTVSQLKDDLTGMLHGGTLNKVRNINGVFRRAASSLQLKVDLINTIRSAPLTNTVHDDVFNYALPSDFKSIIDLYPQDNRNSSDTANKRMAETFSLQERLSNKSLVIEGSEGSKILRVNWRSRQGKVLHTMNDVDDNGTWSAVGTASNIVQDTIKKYSGSGSVRFDIAASGDGIQNTTMNAVDLTNEDEIADAFLYVYLPTTSGITSITAIWGNDLTINYWTAVAQTAQADGTAFKSGWNLLKFPWSTATETGSVNPASIDSFKITLATTAAKTDIRVDNIVFSIGRAFDCKYYSKYIFKDSSGAWLSEPSSDDDILVLDEDETLMYEYEFLIAAAHQIEGADSGFDINFAKGELQNAVKLYRKNNPSMAKKVVSSYGPKHY